MASDNNATALSRLVDERDEQQRLVSALSEERVTIVTALNNKHQEALQFHAEASKQLLANQELVKEVRAHMYVCLWLWVSVSIGVWMSG